MSYTTADEHRDSARQHIQEAIEDLSQIVIHECWGHDGYRPEYRDALEEALGELLRLRKNLGA